MASYELKGVVVTVNLENVEDLRRECPNISFIKLDKLNDIVPIVNSDIDLILVSVKDGCNINFAKMREFLDNYKIKFIFVSDNYSVLKDYRIYGDAMYYSTSVIVDVIASTIISRRKSKLDNYIFDLESRIIYKNGDAIKLRNAGFLIFRHLVKNKGRACSREELLEAVGTASELSDSRTIDVHINYLRNELKDVNIVTVINKGYVYIANNVEKNELV